MCIKTTTTATIFKLTLGMSLIGLHYFTSFSMVGYDWIAAMVDNADDISINERPDEFFQELNAFRKDNWSDCKGVKSRLDSGGGVTASVCEASSSLHNMSSSSVVPVREKENVPLCCTGKKLNLNVCRYLSTHFIRKKVKPLRCYVDGEPVETMRVVNQRCN